MLQNNVKYSDIHSGGTHQRDSKCVRTQTGVSVCVVTEVQWDRAIHASIEVQKHLRLRKTGHSKARS